MKDGLLIPNNSKKDMAEAINLITGNEELRNKLFTNSRDSSKRFFLHNMVNGFDEVIENTLKLHNA
jgi:glycosyltransferase involved in cell wall biosynthesis